MIQNLFSIFDSAARAYMPPFFLPTAAMAVRAFKDCLDDPKHQFANHPSDYTLFHLASFDNQTAVIEPLATPLKLGNGLELKTPTHDPAQLDFIETRKPNGNANHKEA